jgi:aspartate/methionine/tyrosine aminotransferase
MKIEEFGLEEFFARWEFTAPYLMCASDVEGVPLRELLALADDECRGLWEDLHLGYTETAGHPLLRAEIARLYGLAPEEVLVFCGAQEPIFVLMNTLLEPGDHVVVVTPCYQSLHSVARAIGANVALVPLDAERGWDLEIEDIERAMTPRTRLVVVNFPNNPTGALPERRTFEDLAALAESRGAFLLSDEVYRLLENDPADRLPAAVACSPRGISLGVMSKAFGLAGLRIGWVASRDEALLRRAASFKNYTTICAAAPSEILALVALRARDAVLQRAREIVAGNLALLDGLFARWPGVLSWSRPRAGTVGFPKLLAPVPIDDFTRELVEGAGVLILPGTVFDDTDNRFRIGFGRKSLPEALARFEEFLARRRDGGA